MQLFHRTTVSEAGTIIKGGFQDEKWSFGTDDALEDRLKVLGVWLTDKPLAWEDGPPGAAVLEVTLDLPESQINAFEIKGVLEDARLFVVPAALVNPRSKMRIGGVNARSSWFGEQIDEDDEDDDEGDEKA